ncbi:FixH family protein [Ramlibacter humi]|uniref:Nitrogen fixation protein FixH n=1 Tax=Ramlibacter humi TaxID=2530451 RepID=A0A4Z0C828_9BURK|nr:FixH family protein [Ramlibacter humi]TFZ07836.1 nitrogen fixation protein FixH [Ramlibacter humi]
MSDPTAEQGVPAKPWWRYGLVWLVFAGPAVVVVASFVSFFIAARGSDKLVEEDYYRKGVEINQRLAERNLLPAMQGRNHAATPATPAVRQH